MKQDSIEQRLVICAMLTGLGTSLAAATPDYVAWVKTDPKPDWIWSAEGPRVHQQIYLRKQFELPGDAKSARIYTTCDNALVLYINGKSAGATDWWYDPIEQVDAKLLQKGKNIIAADCKDAGGIAGFLFKLEIELTDGKKLIIRSDTNWKASAEAGAEWSGVAFDDSNWKTKLVSHGALGTGPWGFPFVGEGGSRKVVAQVVKAVPKTGATNKEGLDFFERKIRPVLAERCYGCHSAKAIAENKLKSGLQLDTREGLLTGGDRGPALVAGKPGESILLKAIRQSGKLKMPPKGKLPTGVVADFEKWIAMGAPDPRDGKPVMVLGDLVDISEGRQHWAFQPLSKPTPPKVRDVEWIRNDVDRFIRARQEKVDIKPNAAAGHRTLIRRACFDLIGLPPTPEQVDTFVTAADKNFKLAYQSLIDELLASPHYGERWARHWLDLARFAESNGYAFDKDRPNSFRYRDWVIKSLNDGMPYDRFIRMQLAGDLLTTANQPTSAGAQNALDTISATGYLVAGPYTTQQTQKERERSRYEQWDDMVHTLGTSLLGLTVGCARCHSHKYDPIAQTDYYRLAAIFADVGFADTTVNLKPEAYQAARDAYNKAHLPLTAARAKNEKEVLGPLFERWIAEREAKPEPIASSPWSFIGPFKAKDVNEAFAKVFEPEHDWDITKSYGKDKAKLDWKPQPDWMDGKARNDLKGANSAFYLYRTIESPTAQYLSLSLGADEGIKLWVNQFEVVAKRQAGPAKADQIKAELPLKQGRNEILMKIANGGANAGFYFQTKPLTPAKEIAAILKIQPDKWNKKQRETMLNRFKPLNDEWLKLDASVNIHQRDKNPKPELTPVYAASVRGTTYNFGEDRFKVHFLNRGNPDQKRGLAEPGFLQVLMNKEGDPWFQGSGKESKPARLALVDWLTDTKAGAGPLLARVMVNRLWNHHFGRGIVASVSDFGTRGDPPTHPELLDWLAGELIRHDWQLKPIHRLLMTSSTYLQAGEPNPSAAKLDPDDLLWWRRNSRRLEAEVIRDSLLTVSGKLDTKMFGPGSLDEKTPRRSVYLTMKRSQLTPLLQLFDAPDAMQSVGSREESTVAPQALTLLNSPMIREWAGAFAKRMRPDAKTSVPDAIVKAYQTALTRPPTPQERESMTEFVKAQATARGGDLKAEDAAFHDFCHVLLCMNEFVYVD